MMKTYNIVDYVKKSFEFNDFITKVKNIYNYSIIYFKKTSLKIGSIKNIVLILMFNNILKKNFISNININNFGVIFR